jgi:hypothetical protein
MMQLYTGMRTKACKKIMPDPMCTLVEDIEINTNGTVFVGGVELDVGESAQLAWRDGFEGHSDMVTFFEPRLPFKGKLIHWRAL